MTAVERALRHIERLIAGRTPKPAKHGLKTARKKRSEMPQVVSAPVAPTRREEPYNPPRSEPDFTALREAFAPAPPFEVVVTAEGARARPALLFVGGGYRHRAGVILANGELLDDVLDAESALEATREAEAR